MSHHKLCFSSLTSISQKSSFSFAPSALPTCSQCGEFSNTNDNSSYNPLHSINLRFSSLAPSVLAMYIWNTFAERHVQKRWNASMFVRWCLQLSETYFASADVSLRESFWCVSDTLNFERVSNFLPLQWVVRVLFFFGKQPLAYVGLKPILNMYDFPAFHFK